MSEFYHVRTGTQEEVQFNIIQILKEKIRQLETTCQSPNFSISNYCALIEEIKQLAAKLDGRDEN